MSTSLFAELSWLPPAPSDFNERCRALSSGEGPLAPRIRALANYRLNENQLLRLGKAIARARADGQSLRPLDPLRLGILSNATIDFVAASLPATAARHGIDLEIVRSDFGQVMQEALSPDSVLYTSGCNVVLVALDYRWFSLPTSPGDAVHADAVVTRCMAQLEAIQASVRANGGATCIFQTLAPPAESLFGSLDRAIPGTLHNLIDDLNRRLAIMAATTKSILFDVAGLAQTVGLAQWHDATSWNMAKLPFAHEFLPLYADHVGRLLGALRGKARRCLVLDLDNTLWGGVIGDDGLEGIQIAQGDATGEAFLSVQRLALDLRSRGIVLAVSSKNTDEIARRPFQEHPEMLLKLDHIAVFQANWKDKATNITAIAESLSLGLESLVFLDDNPVERDLVRQMLPAVAVPELPADPALYARTLSAAGYFEAIALSPEDLARADFYQDNSRRVALQQAAGDLASYLESLDMDLTLQPFDQTGRSRIAQLISKSNQFNLTTRRYTEADVEAIQNDDRTLHLQVRLSDAFGDNGMISVIIGRQTDDDTLEFDTWLMSCRVLGRNVEQAVLQEVIEFARARGVSRLIGHYIPTERNALVQDHYKKLGFAFVEELPDKTTVWQLDLAAYTPIKLPMRINRVGFTKEEFLFA